MTTIDQTTVDGRPVVTDSEVEHFVCCYHEHVTFCGMFDPDDPTGWVEADEIGCVVCCDLAAASDGMFCPAEPYCRYAAGEGPELPE